MKLVRHEVESEDESRLMWDGGVTPYKVVNKDKPNKFGEYRGYRVLPSQGTAHHVATNSSNLKNAANFAYHDLQITQRKDTEPSSVNTLNQNDMANPAVNFDEFFDSENLIQEGLALWVNLGMHHVPHTGDLPNTVFTTAHTAIQITPSNYFLYDQSRDTVQMIRLHYDNAAKQEEVINFGAAPQICMADLADAAY